MYHIAELKRELPMETLCFLAFNSCKRMSLLWLAESTSCRLGRPDQAAFSGEQVPSAASWAGGGSAVRLGCVHEGCGVTCATSNCFRHEKVASRLPDKHLF